jgi:hypothetical protein
VDSGFAHQPHIGKWWQIGSCVDVENTGMHKLIRFLCFQGLFVYKWFKNPLIQSNFWFSQTSDLICLQYSIFFFRWGAIIMHFYMRNDILTPIWDNLVDNSFIQKLFLFFNNFLFVLGFVSMLIYFIIFCCPKSCQKVVVQITWLLIIYDKNWQI